MRNKTGKAGTYTSQGFNVTSEPIESRYEAKSNTGFYLFIAGLVAAIVGLVNFFI